jgi:hypothetical protein
LYTYLHERFEKANHVFEDIEPTWCRSFYILLRDFLRKTSCDIVLYANDRGFGSDVVITDTTKKMNILSLAELNNLFMDTRVVPDIIVAPSQYALSHGTIVAAMNTSLHTVGYVIPPSVDTALFSPQLVNEIIYHPGCDKSLLSEYQSKRHPCVVIGFIARIAPGINI